MFLTKFQCVHQLVGFVGDNSFYVSSLVVPSKNGRECQKTEEGVLELGRLQTRGAGQGGGSSICVSAQISSPFQLIIRLR